MKTSGLRDITYLKNKIAELDVCLQSRITSQNFESFILTATLVACKIDALKPNSALEQYVSNKNFLQSRKRNRAIQIFKVLKNSVEDIETSFLIEETKKNQEVGNDCCKSNKGIEKLDLLKLQLDLAKQKGFYLMYHNKEKVAIQEEILTVAAHVVQELGCVDDLVYHVMKKFKTLEDFKDLDYVTTTEELIISECYTVLFKTLIDLRYE